MKHMGMVLDEGDAIVNLTVPTGPTFPAIGSRGEVFCIVDSENPNVVVDGLYVYLDNQWKRTSVIQDTPAAKLHRTYITSFKTAEPVQITWSGFSATDSSTAYTSSGADLTVHLSGQYDVWYSVNVSTEANDWVLVETWLTADGIEIPGSRASETIHGRNAPKVTLSGHTIINIVGSAYILLHVKEGDNKQTCDVLPYTNMSIRRIAPL